MRTRCRIARTVVALAAVCVAGMGSVRPVHAQNSLVVVTQVIGPVSNDIFAFPYAIRVTVMNPGRTTINDVTLRMRLIGDNGVEVRTPDAFDPGPPFPLIVPGGATIQLTGADLAPFFDANLLEFSGMTQADYFESALPPGSYRACFQARCPPAMCVSPVEYSPPPPSGCSNIIQIQAVDPPQLISPPCGQTIAVSGPQAMVFAWAPPSRTNPTTTIYTLKIVEMIDPDADPQDAMESATTPAFFEQEIVGTTSFFYGPGQPLLEAGKQYAWRVTATDNELHIPFANGGASAVCSFTYGSAPTGVVVLAQPTPPPPPPPPSSGGWKTVFPKAPWASVKGKLTYKFKDAESQARKSTGTNTGKSTGTSTGGGNLQVINPNPTYYNKGAVDASGAKPLGGIHVSLVVTYRLLDGAVSIAGSSSEKEVVLSKDRLVAEGFETSQLDALLPDIDKVLATGVTASDGTFNLNYVQTEDMGVFAENIDVVLQNPQYAADYQKKYGFNPMAYTLQAKKVTRTLRLIVQSPYYCSPDTDILVQPWGAADVGTLVSFVKGYQYKIHVEATTFAKNQAAVGAMVGVKVFLMRRYAKQAEIPADEGDPATYGTKPVGTETYHVVSMVETDPGGDALFKHLVAPNDLSDLYYGWIETSATKGNYVYKPTLVWDSNPMYDIRNRHIVYNSQLELAPPFEKKEYLSPDQPRIFGRVMDKSNPNTPIASAQILLKSNYKDLGGAWFSPNAAPTFPYSFRASDAQGYFAFDHLDVQEDGAGALVGPDRSLYASKTGYESWTKHLGILARGRQMDLSAEVKLEPEGMVVGAVNDAETKAPVAADVHFDAGITVATKTWLSGPQVFLLRAPTGKGQKLTVVPHDPDYSPKTFTVDITKKNELVNLGTFGVMRKRHRMDIKVVRSPPPNSIMSQMPVPGASVKILGMEVKTNAKGLASFVFDNASAVFQASVSSPDNIDCVPRKKGLLNFPTTSPVPYTIALDPATRVSGRVTVGDSLAVEGARVFIDMGSGPGVMSVETFSKSDGTYTLRGIPLEPAGVTVYATKSSQTTTFVGASKSITVPTKSAVNLNLTVYGDMDITRLLGLPIAITSLVESSGGVTIDGAFVDLPAGPNFKVESGTTLPFYSVTLKAGSKKNAKGVPYAVPAKIPVPTTATSLALTLNGAFMVTASPVGGGTLNVVDAGAGVGALRARVGVDAGSFAFSANDLAFGGKVLTAPGGGDKTITVLQADPQSSAPAMFGLADPNAAGLSFSLYGFPATAASGQAIVSADTIRVRTTLHADIGKGTPLPLDVAAGWVRVRPSQILPVAATGAIAFKLEKWNVSGSGWELGKSTNGIHVATADIHTGVLVVPAKDLRIQPKNLTVDQVDLKNVTLGGVAPLVVQSTNVGFGYDAKVGQDQKGHWKLSMLPMGTTPAATLGNLPGMKSGATFRIESIDLLSDGEQLVGFGANAPAVTFYDVFQFTPGNLTSYDTFFQIAGTVNLGIPRLSTSYQAIMTFTKKAGAIDLALTPIPFQFQGPGNVQFIAQQTAGSQTLDATGFHAAGTLQSSEGLKVVTRLHRTVPKTWLEVDPLHQTIPIGKSKTYLSEIEGSMSVVAAQNDWNKFTFSGLMNGVKGMEGDTRKAFTIHGAITADNQKASIKNIPSSFGSIAITYDYANARMIGTLDFSQPMGAIQVQGVANLLVDASGWYFLSGGSMTVPGFGNLKAGMLIGDYDHMPSDVISTLMQFAYDKSVPSGFQNGISGFFFVGRKTIPQLDIPDVGFKLGPIGAYFGGETGLDGRVWMSFDGPGTEFGIGGMAYVNAYFIMSSITCTKVSGEASAEMGAKGVINVGTGQYDLQGCGSLTVGGSVEQCIPTPCLDGICCELCGGIDVSKSLKVTMSLGTSGVNASVGLGSCSGNEPPLTSGW